ncbi:hybrid sensor histidine kinase/response regulator transcription factor [Salinibacter ruber]|uniref:histidine kinase n=1 Tax=Salinibacter ruber TaxID=146919 RepID=A0A9X2U851_9BACT|nr:response regulator [Salinibacter ruber]MCS3656522.1 CheY-like chemotaxis protein/AraC-like DNA-binding protein [Salinibacter ruber]MCS3951551.1 CheY-like chemotaxis protein/AraC-like DNA-binding protein [Salinibacter ruber]MCS4117730.1 CheY-like chemotaxis protein/AraC-like DNA-binding protein [Salinibacter ruber]MCS4170037.1 CheY-like chemotaxis protein/AraC-like DNA-binding protein [Salinibacter ruber]MCS4187510.1 CheY-like chemotaxis protein/AraC-like DNA-binding protein [Salinibacter ru
MTASPPADSDGPAVRAWTGPWGMSVGAALFGLGGLVAGRLAGAAAVGWGGVLLAGGGIGAMVLLHGRRLRRVRRRAAARIDAARDDRDAAREALDTATDRIETLEEMRTAKSQFLEEISHAFRRPLTLTLGPIDTLLEGRHGALGDEVRTQLRLAERNGTRLLWLVNQLLDLAELETGRMSLTPTDGHLPSVVVQGVRSFEGLAERRNVHLHFESTLDDPVARFDETKMETMLANLLSSAFQAAGEDGTIQVIVRPCAAPPSAEPETDGLELVVEHTGTQGHPPAEDDLWGTRDEPSFRAPDRISTRLGLRLVDELATLHEGALQIDPAADGTVRYAVRLPRCPPGREGLTSDANAGASSGDTGIAAPDDDLGQDPLALSREALAGRADASAPAPEAPAASPDEDRTTVLVIDDNSVVCTLVRTHLEPEYRVEEAHDGAEGYTLARTLLPDLVISDVMMPEVDGFELCRKIKQDPDIDHVPVVFLTARADLEDKVEGLDVGADAYLTKPFEPEALIARIENLIATRRTLRESFRNAGTAGGESRHSPDEAGNGAEKAKEALPPTAEAAPLRDRIEEAIAERLTDPDFGVSELAAATALSASQLRRRMKAMYDRTPVQLIRHRRLEAGARLLQERADVTIGEVAYAVGFNSQSYFSRSFREAFGVPPSQYRGEGAAA